MIRDIRPMTPSKRLLIGSGPSPLMAFCDGWRPKSSADGRLLTDGHRMIEIINGVQLEFFDQHLKGKPMTGDLLDLYPEIIGSDSGQ